MLLTFFFLNYFSVTPFCTFQLWSVCFVFLSYLLLLLYFYSSQNSVSKINSFYTIKVWLLLFCLEFVFLLKFSLLPLLLFYAFHILYISQNRPKNINKNNLITASAFWWELRTIWLKLWHTAVLLQKPDYLTSLLLLRKLPSKRRRANTDREI